MFALVRGAGEWVWDQRLGADEGSLERETLQPERADGGITGKGRPASTRFVAAICPSVCLLFDIPLPLSFVRNHNSDLFGPQEAGQFLAHRLACLHRQ